MAERTKAHGKAGVGDAGAVAQARGGPGETDVGQDAMGRAPFEFGKDPREVKEAHSRIVGQPRERERFGIARFDHLFGSLDTAGIPREAIGPIERRSRSGGRKGSQQRTPERLDARLVSGRIPLKHVS